MKPENILLDEHGNAALADFGVSKFVQDDQMTFSYVGTPEYVAPEIIYQKGHGKAVDVWCLGVLLYEMIYGLPPFYSKEQQMMLNQVLKLQPYFPSIIKISNELKLLIQQCLNKDPEKRFVLSWESVKEHPWFSDVNWEDVQALRVPAPIQPRFSDEYDISYFNQNVVTEEARLSATKEMDLEVIQNHTEEFSEF